MRIIHNGHWLMVDPGIAREVWCSSEGELHPTLANSEYPEIPQAYARTSTKI